MSATGITFAVLIVFGFVHSWITSRFLSALHDEQPETFEQVATQWDVNINPLGTLRFGLLYAIPRMYDFWDLSLAALRRAGHLRAMTFIEILIILNFVGFLFVENI